MVEGLPVFVYRPFDLSLISPSQETNYLRHLRISPKEVSFFPNSYELTANSPLPLPISIFFSYLCISV
jgi:hypothetical protein